MSVTTCPGFTVPTLNVMVLPLAAKVPCWAVADTYTNWLGSGSVTITFVAAAVPLFVTVMVNTTVSPGRARDGLPTLVIPGSATPTLGVGVTGIGVLVGVRV